MENKKVKMGYYIPEKGNRILIAISTSKDILKTYLKEHRNLDKNHYEIETSELSDAELLVKYSDYVIDRYYDYYIPDIDIQIIGVYSREIEDELNCCINQLKHITAVSMEVKKCSKSDVATLVAALKKLIEFQKSQKTVKQLSEKNALTDPFLFCDIKEYLSTVGIFKDRKNMDSAYHYAIYKD